MSLGLSHRAYGLDTPRGEPWETRAACAQDPDLWTGDLHGPGYTLGERVVSFDAAAAHICLKHCPVFDDCQRKTDERPPQGLIQAGVAWATHSARRSKHQPELVGHGPWCHAWRRRAA